MKFVRCSVREVKQVSPENKSEISQDRGPKKILNLQDLEA
jgi:hypothetical protein